ncbi:MAG: hypothetical protein ACRD3O_06070 [Terriglobia bacterium]
MPDDDLERFRKFMIEQQAQFWADLRAAEERHNRHEREMAEFRAEMEKRDREMKEFRQETENRFRTLVDVTMSLARHGEETDRRFRETDYKLNALIDTVDKLVKRNGAS